DGVAPSWRTSVGIATFRMPLSMPTMSRLRHSTPRAHQRRGSSDSVIQEPAPCAVAGPAARQSDHAQSDDLSRRQPRPGPDRRSYLMAIIEFFHLIHIV